MTTSSYSTKAIYELFDKNAPEDFSGQKPDLFYLVHLLCNCLSLKPEHFTQWQQYFREIPVLVNKRAIHLYSDGGIYSFKKNLG